MVVSTEGSSKKRGRPSKKDDGYAKKELPPPPRFPCAEENVRVILKKWLEDRVIELPPVTTVPTAEDEKHSRFCIYHKKISHRSYVLRDIFDKKIRSGELRLQGNVDANPLPGHKGKAVANMISSAWSSNFEEEIQRGAPCEYHRVDTSEPIEERLKNNKKLLAFFDSVCFTESVRADAVKALVGSFCTVLHD